MAGAFFWGVDFASVSVRSDQGCFGALACRHARMTRSASPRSSFPNTQRGVAASGRLVPQGSNIRQSGLCGHADGSRAASSAYLESLTKPINKSPADDGASQGEQSEVSLKRTLETNAQLAESSKPGMGAFDHPAMLAEPVVLLDATASDPGSHAPLAQMPAASREVVSLIRVKLVGAASRAAIESWHARDGVNEHLEHHRVVTIGTGDHQRQRHAAPIYDEMALATELAAICWIRPRLLAPRGLATVAPSTLARLQSIWSCSRRRLSRAKCSRSQTPLACHSRRRRQHVMPLPKPSSLGRSSHGIPVCRTNRMPLSAARSSTRGRPPLVEGSTTGSSGCNAFHSSLLIFFRAMPTTTLNHLRSMTWFC